MILSLILTAVLAASSGGVAERAEDGQRHGKSAAQAERANDVATAEAIGADGAIYVTGYSKSAGSGYDFLTVKYSPEGTELWAKRLDGGSKGDDKPVAVCVDSVGNAYVTGSSGGGSGDSDYLTVKYDTNGALVWERRVNGTGNGFDAPESMVIDGSGNVYITGYSLTKDKGYNCLTVSYDSAGTQRWMSDYDGGDGEDDFGSAVAVDATESCFVTGYSKTKRDGASYLTIKFDSSGHGVWVRNFAIGSTQTARATSLAADNVGGVCVTGFAQGSHASLDCVTIRYSPDGKALWAKRLDGPGHGDDKPAAIAMDSAGNFLICGETYSSVAAGTDMLAAKYSPSGELLWQTAIDGSGLSDAATGMASDSTGGIAMIGKSIGVQSGSDILTVKLSAQGKEVWRAKFNGEANDVDKPVAVSTDKNGNIVVLGSSWGGKASGFDFVTLKYAPDGRQLWTKRFDGKGVTK